MESKTVLDLSPSLPSKGIINNIMQPEGRLQFNESMYEGQMKTGILMWHGDIGADWKKFDNEYLKLKKLDVLKVKLNYLY